MSSGTWLILCFSSFVDCLSNKDCPAYSACSKGKCKCRDELVGDGKTCKPGRFSFQYLFQDVEKQLSKITKTSVK